MTSTTPSTRRPRRTSIAAGSIAGLLVMAVWSGSGLTTAAHAQSTSRTRLATSTPGAPAPTKAQLLNPKHKYYGISLAGAPTSLSGVTTITKQTGKQPNLLMFYESWDAGAAKGKTNIDTASIKRACQQGLLPMLTWQSWDVSAQGGSAKPPNAGVAWSQPAFAPAKILTGTYDPYIRATAKLIAGLGANCPIALRFDHEQNGYWYPWGVNTEGMPGTQAQRAADYIKMWRHVWRIFNSAGATNVLWTWSPNYQSLVHPKVPDLKATYPGRKYVDWVGIDAYYNKQPQSFDKLFGPTMQQLQHVANKKPWMIAETGVGSYNAKPAQITDLLTNVASNSRLNGVVYFEQSKPGDRNYWPFDDPNEPRSLPAFKKGIANPVFAAGKPGSL